MRKGTLYLLASVFVMVSSVCAAAEIKEFAVPGGAHPHDVAPAADGGVWYTAQHQGALGYLNPKTGKTRNIPLGKGSAPHGVIVGPDGAAWITDSGMNANVRVDPKTETFAIFKSTSRNPSVRQILGRPGKVWLTESGADKLVVIRE